MKKLTTFFSVLVALMFTLVSCSKDSPDSPEMPIGNGAMTMDVDGNPWKAMYTFMYTLPPDDDSADYTVVIVGTEVDVTKGDDNADPNGLNMFISIPQSKFKNPTGVYEIRAWNDDEDRHSASAWYNRTVNSQTVAYWPYYDDVNGVATVIGTINITQFDIGKQKTPEYEEVEGYTKLSGTFSMNLTQVQMANGDFENVELKITNGKFSLKSGIDFGGMFFGTARMLEEVKNSKSF